MYGTIDCMLCSVRPAVRPELEFVTYARKVRLNWSKFFFTTEPRDWLGRPSPKWPVLCRVGRWTLLHPSFLLGQVRVTGSRTQTSKAAAGDGLIPCQPLLPSASSPAACLFKLCSVPWSKTGENRTKQIKITVFFGESAIYFVSTRLVKSRSKKSFTVSCYLYLCLHRCAVVPSTGRCITSLCIVMQNI